MSRKRTFKADDKSESPLVKASKSTNAVKVIGKLHRDRVFNNTTGIKNKIKAAIRWTRLDNMIDNGITAWGNLAFLIKLRSNTIDGVALVKDKEKKFQTSSPKNK